MRRALASAVLAAVAAWPGASPAGKRFIVAIMDMEARDVRLAAGQREKLTIYLGTAIAETGAFRAGVMGVSGSDGGQTPLLRENTTAFGRVTQRGSTDPW